MISRLVVSFFLLSLLACNSAMKIHTDFDREISLANYKTFGWPDSKLIESRNNPLYYNELNDKRIKKEVDLRLKNLGYEYAETAPDLVIHYHIIMEQRTVVNPDPLGYSYGPYWLNRNVNVYEYREGTLIIDLMDRKTSSLVWRGWAVNFLDEEQPEKIEGQIKKATQKIFDRFPIKKTSGVQPVNKKP